MTRHIDKTEAGIWTANAAKLRQASDLLADVSVSLLLELGGKHRKAIERARAAEDAASGLAYLFTPQPEWTGGDSMDAGNFKMRPPHIVTD